MKKHLSVLMLLIRSTIYKYLGLVLVFAAAQAGLFYLAVERIGSTDLAATMADSHIHWAFVACFLLVTALLSSTGCEQGSRQGYTLRRLRISEEQVFVWQAVYNTGMYLLLWAAEVGVVLGLSGWFVSRVDPAAVTHQSVFVASYQCAFFHSLMPLADVTRWVFLTVMCLCLGITTAGVPYRQRRRTTPLAAIAMMALTLFVFCRGMGEAANDVMLAILMLIPAVSTIVRVVGEEDVSYEI